MLNDRKILITGGLGFVGSNLAHACVQAGAQVTILDNADPRSGGRRYNLHGIEDRVRLCERDICADIEDVVASQEFIFHCAASTSHSRSMREPEHDLHVNCGGSLNLLQTCLKVNPQARILYTGTSTQLGALQHRPADETHPQFAYDIYSSHKAAAENYFLIYARTHGLKTKSIRFANLYGPRAAIHSPEFTFNNFFIGQALQKRPVTVYGDGAQLRNLMFIEDAVQALLTAASHDHGWGEIFFAAAQESLSIAEIARRIADAMGSAGTSFIDWPAGRKNIEFGDAVISSSKLFHATGWQPRTGLDEGLALTRAYYESCLEQYLSEKLS